MYALASHGVNYFIYTVIAYLVSCVMSFFLNQRFTFKTQDFVQRRLLLFMLINIMNLLLVECLQGILINYYNISEFAGVGVGIFAYSLLGFYMNQKFVFNRIPNKRLAVNNLLG